MQKELSGQEKNILFFISNEDNNDFIKIIKSLENSNLLIDGITESAKHQIEKARRWTSSCFVGTFSCN